MPKFILQLVWVRLLKLESIVLMYFYVSTLMSLNKPNASSMSACCDAATRKPIQYNTCFIVFFIRMFSYATTSWWIKHSYYSGAAACIFGFCALGALFFFLAYFLSIHGGVINIPQRFMIFFTLLLWSMRSSIVYTCLGLINQVDYEL